MISYRIIFQIVGFLVTLTGILMLSSTGFSLYYSSDDLYPILFTSLGSIFFGFIMWFFNRKSDQEIKIREGHIISPVRF